MKIRMPLIAACLLVLGVGVPRSVHADDTRPHTPLSSSHQKMQDDANASAQAETDMSYGGTPDTRGASGNAAKRSCGPGLRCDLYFGQ